MYSISAFFFFYRGLRKPFGIKGTSLDSANSFNIVSSQTLLFRLHYRTFPFSMLVT